MWGGLLARPFRRYTPPRAREPPHVRVLDDRDRRRGGRNLRRARRSGFATTTAHPRRLRARRARAPPRDGVRVRRRRRRRRSDAALEHGGVRRVRVAPARPGRRREPEHALHAPRPGAAAPDPPRADRVSQAPASGGRGRGRARRRERAGDLRGQQQRHDDRRGDRRRVVRIALVSDLPAARPRLHARDRYASGTRRLQGARAHRRCAGLGAAEPRPPRRLRAAARALRADEPRLESAAPRQRRTRAVPRAFSGHVGTTSSGCCRSRRSRCCSRACCAATMPIAPRAPASRA